MRAIYGSVVTILVLALTTGLRPYALEEESSFPAACPDLSGAWGGSLVNTYQVPQLGGGGGAAAEVPFVVTSYSKFGGQPPGASVAWYDPYPTSTMFGRFRYDWVQARVEMACWGFVRYGINIVVAFRQGFDGHAVLVVGTNSSEEWRGGGGDTEGSGNEECWQVWLVWRDANGIITDEEYLGRVCFDNKGSGSGGVT